MFQRERAIESLLRWQMETGRKLPLSPEQIVGLENLGRVVDLETGEVSALNPDAYIADPSEELEIMFLQGAFNE